MLKISLLNEVGEFCTERTNPKIPEIKAKIRDALIKKNGVKINWDGVKIFTPSFIDELFGDLVKEFEPESILKFCKFEPELYYSFQEQIERSARLRGWKKQSA